MPAQPPQQPHEPVPRPGGQYPQGGPRPGGQYPQGGPPPGYPHGGYQGDDEQRPKNEKRKLWLRPVFWMAGIIVTALGLAITGILVPILMGLRPETGDPVDVLNVETYWKNGHSVALPDQPQLTNAQIAQLNEIKGEEAKAEWLVEHGGAALETVYIRLTVAGNRDNTVRIVDIRPISDCESSYDGALFLLPPAGGDPSTLLNFNLDDHPDPEATYRNESNDVVAFFPENTVSLAIDEQHVFNVSATTSKYACDFDLELTILEGDRVFEKTVSDSDKPFQVTARMDYSLYRDVYPGGVICGKFVRAPESYSVGDSCPR